MISVKQKFPRLQEFRTSNRWFWICGIRRKEYCRCDRKRKSLLTEISRQRNQGKRQKDGEPSVVYDLRIFIINTCYNNRRAQTSSMELVGTWPLHNRRAEDMPQS